MKRTWEINHINMLTVNGIKYKKKYISYHIEEMQLDYSIWHHMSLKGENKYLILHDGKLINIFIMSYMNGNHKIILLQNGGYK